MNKKFKIAADIEINPMEDGYVIYQAEKDRVHYLNHTAVLILECCNGKNSEHEMVQILQQAFELPELPEKEMKECLDSMLKEGLVC